MAKQEMFESDSQKRLLLLLSKLPMIHQFGDYTIFAKRRNSKFIYFLKYFPEDDDRRIREDDYDILSVFRGNPEFSQDIARWRKQNNIEVEPHMVLTDALLLELVEMIYAQCKIEGLIEEEPYDASSDENSEASPRSPIRRSPASRTLNELSDEEYKTPIKIAIIKREIPFAPKKKAYPPKEDGEVKQERWISLKHFTERYETEKLCAYSPNVGRRKKKVCAKIPVNTDLAEHWYEFRCQECINKKGMIEHRVRVYLAKQEWYRLRAEEKKQEKLELPTKKKTQKKLTFRTPRGPNNKSHWFTREEFKSAPELCSYVCTRGKNKDLVCGARPLNTEEKNPSRLRCKKHQDMIGGDLVKVNRWITFDEYMSCPNPICAYMPSKGQNIHKVCGAPTKMLLDIKSPFKWRCKKCYGKIGCIAKFYYDVPSQPKLNDETWVENPSDTKSCRYVQKLCNARPNGDEHTGMYCNDPKVRNYDETLSYLWRCESHILKGM